MKLAVLLGYLLLILFLAVLLYLQIPAERFK